MNRRSFFKAIPLAAIAAKSTALKDDTILFDAGHRLSFKPEPFSMADHSENWHRVELPQAAWDFPGHIIVSNFPNDQLSGVPLLIESVFGVVAGVQLAEQYIGETGEDFGVLDNSPLNKFWARILKHIAADPEYKSYKENPGRWNRCPPSEAALCATAQSILVCFSWHRESIAELIEFYRLKTG
jgi:hypothetical protein